MMFEIAFIRNTQQGRKDHGNRNQRESTKTNRLKKITGNNAFH
jgi:hypothetical protein